MQTGACVRDAQGLPKGLICWYFLPCPNNGLFQGNGDGHGLLRSVAVHMEVYIAWLEDQLIVWLQSKESRGQELGAGNIRFVPIV